MRTGWLRRTTLLTLWTLLITAPNVFAASAVVTTIFKSGSSCTTSASSYSSTYTSTSWGMFVDTSSNLYYISGSTAICKWATNGQVIRVAGTGSIGTGADSISATSSAINNAAGVTVDSFGNIYYTDSGSHSVRKVDLNGTVSTIFNTAHTNATGTVTGAVASTSTVMSPWGITIDNLGRTVFTDTNGCSIWRIETNGTATLIAGGRTCSDSGISNTQGVNLAVNAGLGTQLQCLGSDSSGNLYFCDAHHIGKIDGNGYIYWLIGTGVANTNGDGGAPLSASINTPYGVAIDVAGNIYWNENLGNVIRKLDITTNKVSNVAGNGVATQIDGNGSSASFMYPKSIAVNKSGEIFTSDNGNGIRKITGGATPLLTTPSVSIAANLIYRTSSIITVTTTTSGQVTFYQNGKPIPGCKNVRVTSAIGGTANCSYKPSIHANVRLDVTLVNGNFSISAVSNSVPISIRSGSR